MSKIFIHCLLLLSCAVLPLRAEEAKRMNVLFIISDDLNTHLNCYGDSQVKTPNVDRLAQHSIKFEKAYVQFPMCNPSRTSFLSGMRPEATQVFGNGTPARIALKTNTFLPEYFHQNGYYVARVGKVAHQSDPESDPVKWDFADSPESPTKSNKQKTEAQIDVPPSEFSDELEQDGLIARHSVKLMEDHKDKPFFIAVGFHKPHCPLIVPKTYYDFYPKDKINLTAEPVSHLEAIPKAALYNHLPEINEEQRKQIMSKYFACVTYMDAQVGLLLDTMDRLKLWDNTIVVFIGDHGWSLGEHGGQWAKPNLFEECVRAPMLMWAPGKKSGISCQRLVEFIDFYPTLADLCALKIPENLEGTSFKPLLDEPNRAWKSAAFTSCVNGTGKGECVHTERYHYNNWGEGNGEELYDLQSDPHEFKNLANDPESTEVLKEMKRLLAAGWKQAIP
jgi:iduronate 2-sulfatase